MDLAELLLLLIPTVTGAALAALQALLLRRTTEVKLLVNGNLAHALAEVDKLRAALELAHAASHPELTASPVEQLAEVHEVTRTEEAPP